MTLYIAMPYIANAVLIYTLLRGFNTNALFYANIFCAASENIQEEVEEQISSIQSSQGKWISCNPD